MDAHTATRRMDVIRSVDQSIVGVVPAAVPAIVTPSVVIEAVDAVRAAEALRQSKGLEFTLEKLIHR